MYGVKNAEDIFISTVRMSQSMHLPLGVPGGGQGGGACLLTNNHSVTLYSTILHIPLWVAFTLTTEVHTHLHEFSYIQCNIHVRAESLQKYLSRRLHYP